MSEPVLITEIHGSTAVLKMNRPEARNALDAERVVALTEAFGRVSGDASVRVVILTGEGAAFCGGADLKTLQGLQAASAAQNMEDAARFKSLFRSIGTCPKPVIAAVNGPALAGGCGLVSLCDVVLACPEATFGYPEVRIGFVAAMVLVFLSRQLGERRAKDLLLTGRTLNAEEAQAMGVVTRIVPCEALLDEALGSAREFRRSSPASMALTKELLWRTAGLSTESALDLAEMVNTYARTTPDVREGLSAFLEKRRTSWSQK